MFGVITDVFIIVVCEGGLLVVVGALVVGGVDVDVFDVVVGVLVVDGGSDVVGGVLVVGGVVGGVDVVGGCSDVVGGRVVGGTDELVSGGEAVVGGLVGELLSGSTLVVGDAGGSDVAGLFVLVLLDMTKAARRFKRGNSLGRPGMLATRTMHSWCGRAGFGINCKDVGEMVGRRGTDWSRPEHARCESRRLQ